MQITNAVVVVRARRIREIGARLRTCLRLKGDANRNPIFFLKLPPNARGRRAGE